MKTGDLFINVVNDRPVVLVDSEIKVINYGTVTAKWVKVLDETGKIVPIEKFGIKAMSIGLLVDEKQAVVWRGPMASSALKQFITDVHWGELDYLIIDLPPGKFFRFG